MMQIDRLNCPGDANIFYIEKTKCHLVSIVWEHSNSATTVYEYLEVCDAFWAEYSVKKNFRIEDRVKYDFEMDIKWVFAD